MKGVCLEHVIARSERPPPRRRTDPETWRPLSGSQMGLKPFVKNDAERLATVNTIEVPEGVDFAKVIGNAMEKFSVEIAGGLGPSAGKVWRIGVMGANANPFAVKAVLTAMEDGLRQQKYL